MKKFLAKLLIAGCLSFGVTGSAFGVTITKPDAVVELFTSQGCYSCPAADKVLGKFSENGNILGLSWHVNYWDYLGWKDTFASAENTERQYGYARSLRERQVYTPQAIINGREHAEGWDEAKIRSMASAFKASGQGMFVPIDVTMKDDSLHIQIDEGAVEKSATLYMVFFNKVHTVDIARGENGGKTLVYHNVVHKAQPLGLVKRSGFDMGYPKMEIAQSDFESCAIILQTNDKNGNPGAVIGAVVISDW